MAGGIHKTIAAQNEALIAAGSYTGPRGGVVELEALVEKACAGTRLYSPIGAERLLSRQSGSANAGREQATTEVTGESSMQAAQWLVAEDATGIAVLNFASGRNPGGGYLGGARAQEEDLCRVSALYRTLLLAPEYYATHRATRDPFYSHHIIYSPNVPVFRDERYVLLDQPYTVSFLTSPAPNAGVIARDHPDRLGDVPRVLAERAARVLAVAAEHGERTLVLGAWGCGVFQNDPGHVAAAFRDLLGAGGEFARTFDRVVFAVLDRAARQPNLTAFRAAFPADGPGQPARRGSDRPDHPGILVPSEGE